jgi:hypothetical protein
MPKKRCESRGEKIMNLVLYPAEENIINPENAATELMTTSSPSVPDDVTSSLNNLTAAEIFVINQEDGSLKPLDSEETYSIYYDQTFTLLNDQEQTVNSEVLEEISNSTDLNNTISTISVCSDDFPVTEIEVGEAEGQEQTVNSGVLEEISNLTYVNNAISTISVYTNDVPVTDIEIGVAEGQEISPLVSRKRRKRHQVDENSWTYKKAKSARESGKQYQGRKRDSDGKVKFMVPKKKRDMGPIKCKCKPATFHCSRLQDGDRKEIFKKFWKLTWEGKKSYVRGLTDISLTMRARDRKEAGKTRREFSYKYFLQVNLEKLRVCKGTFLSTLGIGEWMVLNWLKEEKSVESEDSSQSSDNEVSEQKTTRRKKACTEELRVRHGSLKEFFSSLAKVESHYCRATSKKLYLEPNWGSKQQLYEFYCKDWCIKTKLKPLSSCTFHKVFEDLNLGLYRPKKDECDVCRAYKLNQFEEIQYQEHIKNKEAARAEKEQDKNEEQNVFTVDLQSLLLCPKSNASALYYRCKLSVHNYTIYNLKNKIGYCYIWNESEGKLTANEFSSILVDFIESIVPSLGNNKKIIFYSDGCNYQNRNTVLSNSLLYVAEKHGLSIEQKYLLKGHTQMECDSMHATIERKLKNIDINVPADYIAACQNARKTNAFNVKYINHEFFKDFSKLNLYKSIRPGKIAGDAKVTDIKCLKYAEGTIKYKLSFEEEYEALPLRKTKINRNVCEIQIPNLYKTRLPINQVKFNHLQELKLTIPKDYHPFYDALPTVK